MIEKLEYFKDPCFKFDPISHSYTYVNLDTGKPIQIFESVSGFISQFKPPFDSDKIDCNRCRRVYSIRQVWCGQ